MNQMWEYVVNLFHPSRKNPSPNINLKAMHGINKISIIVFLAGMIYLIIKLAR
jgi:hypothetical protein